MNEVLLYSPIESLKDSNEPIITNTTESNQEGYPLTKENSKRFVLFPIKYPQIWSLYKQLESDFWLREKYDFSTDLNDWRHLNENERWFISHVLIYLASASNGLVTECLARRFMNEIQIAESRSYLGFVICTENIHSETYATIIDLFIQNEKIKLLNNDEWVKNKRVYCHKWITENNSFSERLVAYCAYQYLFFGGSFCALSWFKKQHILLNTTLANDQIKKDKHEHCKFGCLLYSMLYVKLDQTVVHTIINEAVECEKDFITNMLPIKLIGLHSDLMRQYIEFLADQLLQALGYQKLYQALNPYFWVEHISLQTSFSEKQITHVLNNKINTEANVFITSDEF